MEFLTKEFINRLISEELGYDLDEMAKPKSEKWKESFLGEPMTLNVQSIRDIPVTAVDVKGGEQLDPGVIKSNIVRTSPTGHRLIEFINLENGKRVNRYVEIDDAGSPINTFKFPPRLPKYGTGYEGPTDMETQITNKIQKLQKVQKTYGHDVNDPNLRTKMAGVIQLNAKDEWAKRNVVHPILNAFFSESGIIKHLDKCGIPEVLARATFTEPSTNISRLDPNKQRHSNFNGPDMVFNYHSVRDDDDVQNAIDKIISYRMSIETGEKMKGKRQSPGKMVRQYGGQQYPGGKWDPEQRTYDKPHFELTPIYKLYKQAVQKGEKAFNVITDLDVIGKVVGGRYVLTMSFTATNSVRTATSSMGSQRGKLFEPIRVNSVQELPGDSQEVTVANNKDFFKELFRDCLTQLGEKLLEVEPDAVLEKLLFEPEEVISDPGQGI